MAKISPFSSFRLEDFPTQREWIGTLFLPLNTVLTQVTQALNGQLNSDNIPTMNKVIEGSNLSLPLTFKVTTTGLKPTQMVVAQALKAGSPITMVGAWSVSGDTITVNQLFEISASGNTALTTGIKYSVILRFT
jgi:hypothetical protein